jgi:hypothetical protein
MSEPTPRPLPESTVPPLGDEQTSAGNERPIARKPSAKRAAVTSIKVGIVMVVATVGLAVVAFVAASSYEQYGAIRNEPNADAWAHLTPRYAGQAICVSCHEPEARTQDASIHVNVSCENCHGPLAAHSTSDAAARDLIPAKPPGEICITCHAATAGRPPAFSQIDPGTHYIGGECLRCHDPHSITAVRPPIVSHPLVDLPVCTTCHAPDGLKKIPAGHELVDDRICLSCHGQSASGRP